MTDQMIVIVADVVEVDVTVIEMVEEIEDGRFQNNNSNRSYH